MVFPFSRGRFGIHVELGLAPGDLVVGQTGGGHQHDAGAGHLPLGRGLPAHGLFKVRALLVGQLNPTYQRNVPNELLVYLTLLHGSNPY